MAGGLDAAVEELAPEQYSSEEISETQITDAIDEVDGIAQDVMSRSGVPGMAVAVVHDGEVAFAKGYGVREQGKPETVDEEHRVPAGVRLQIHRQHGDRPCRHDGTVSWSDPIVKYLPDFQLADPAVTQTVTIGDLYSHRSGIPGGAGDDLEGIGFDREQIIQKLRYYPLNPFRITYGYTNFGMTTGGQAVAAAAGIPWEELSAKELYEPLGMDFHQLHLRRLHRQAQSRHPAFHRGRRVRGALHPQRRRSVTGRWSEFDRHRPGQVDEHEPGVGRGRPASS